MFTSTKLRAEIARRITRKHYEPGKLKKSYKAVWGKYIRKEIGVCYRTYLRYIHTPSEEL